MSLVYVPGLSAPTGELAPCVEETLARLRSRRRAEAMRDPLREWVVLSERTKPLLDEAGRRFYEGDFRLWREADRELAAPVARMAELSRMVCEIHGGGDEFRPGSRHCPCGGGGGRVVPALNRFVVGNVFVR